VLIAVSVGMAEVDVVVGVELARVGKGLDAAMSVEDPADCDVISVLRVSDVAAAVAVVCGVAVGGPARLDPERLTVPPTLDGRPSVYDLISVVTVTGLKGLEVAVSDAADVSAVAIADIVSEVKLRVLEVSVALVVG